MLAHDAEQVEAVRRFGWKAFYGDATRLDLLLAAGAAKARSAWQPWSWRNSISRRPRWWCARNATDWTTLHLRGVQHVERETLDSALMSGRSVLEAVGWQPHAARTQALRFRQHSIELMKKLAPHLGDEKKLIAVAEQGRAPLEETWAQERNERVRQGADTGWHKPETDE